MLTVIDIGGGKYSAQFGKSDFAESLNELNSSYLNPYVLVITDEAMYALDKTNALTVVDSYLINSHLSRNAELNYDEPDVTFETIALVNNIEVVISENNAYNETINYISPRTFIEGYLQVPFVPNGSTAAYPEGYCWASALASIIKYRTSTSKTAVQILDELLSQGIKGYDYQIKPILENYVGGSVTLKSGTGKMSCTAINQCISAGKPIYTDWQCSSASSAHAMVVRGCSLNTALSGPNGEYGVASLMDPNKSSYQIISLSPEAVYKIDTNNYTWYSSVY